MSSFEVLSELTTMQHKNKCGEMTWVEAIDPQWLEDLDAPAYFVLNNTDQLQEKSWCSTMERMVSTCSRLLNMPSHKFWSHMVHDPEIDKMISSYLEKCPRYSDPETMNLMFFTHTKLVCQTQRTLHSLFLRILMRIATPRASQPNELPLDGVWHGKMLMSGLMDVARFTEVCAVYAIDNRTLLQKMGRMLLANVNGFSNNLCQFCQATGHVLDGILDEVSKAQVLRRGEGMGKGHLFDLSLAICDCAFTIKVLLDIVPRSAIDFVQQGVASRLPSFMKNAAKTLMDEALAQQKINGGFSYQFKEVVQRLRLFDVTAVHIFRVCIETGCLAVIQNKQSSDSEKNEAFDSFSMCVSSCSDNRAFAAKYNAKYPLDQDLATLANAGFFIDPSQLDYMDTGLTNNRPSSPNEQSTSARQVENPVNDLNDILPEENKQFLKAMLARYNGSKETVLNHILSGDVPSELNNLRKGPATFVPQPKKAVPKKIDAIDGVRPIDRGKKHGKFCDLDRTELEDDNLKRIFEKFAVEDDSMMYEDEYDDTYDPLYVGAFDSQAETDRDLPRNTNYDAAPEPPSEIGEIRGGFSKPKGAPTASSGSSTYTGGRQRQVKDRHTQHNRKNANAAKMRKGMF